MPAARAEGTLPDKGESRAGTSAAVERNRRRGSEFMAIIEPRIRPFVKPGTIRGSVTTHHPIAGRPLPGKKSPPKITEDLRTTGVTPLHDRAARAQKNRPANRAVNFNLAATYSHMAYRHTTIGAKAFHFRVRNGAGWFRLAMATRVPPPHRAAADLRGSSRKPCSITVNGSLTTV